MPKNVCHLDGFKSLAMSALALLTLDFNLKKKHYHSFQTFSVQKYTVQ